jgi:two-component system CheB/CheR fusion protein
MMFYEEMEDAQKSLPVKIFATDIDRGALEFAGEGVYPESIALDVNPERLQRFFIKSGDNYRIDRQIREMVVFASHNLINDPPFTRMDLISCRNLLIYLQPVLQRRVLSNFAFSLNSKGFLFLGSSETVGDLVDHFSSMDNKWKIYRHRGGPKPHLDYPATLSNRLTSHMSGSSGIEMIPGYSRQDRVFEQIYNQLVEGYGLKCLVVNEQGVLLYTFGDVSELLNFRVGAASLQIQNLIRSELSIALGTALHRFRKEAKEIVYSGIPLDQTEESRKVNIRIRPSTVRKDNSRLIFVFVEDSGAIRNIGTNFTSGTIDSQTQERIVDLERELGYSRENLQSTVEELETSNEELQATNEELLASNEELQSTNEELHSVNEELHTVNTEYQGKIQELIELSNDLDNLLLHTSLGIVFLDENLKIRRFTEACKNYINLRDLDLGRPIAELSHVLSYQDFYNDLKSVLNSKTSIKKTVRLLDGGHSFVRILPYRKGESHLDGVVVVFVDTSDLVEKEAALRRTEDTADAVTELLDAFVISVKPVLDGSCRICFASKATAQTLGYTADELINMSLAELGSDELVRIVREMHPNNVLKETVTLTRKDGTTINMRFRAKQNDKLDESLTHMVFFPVSDTDDSQFYGN